MPEAIKVGIPYAIFWNLTPNKLKYVSKAYAEKTMRDLELADSLEWRLGQYMTMAISSVLNKSGKYPKKPIGFSEEDQSTEIDINLKAEISAKKFEDYMSVFNKRFEK